MRRKSMGGSSMRKFGRPVKPKKRIRDTSTQSSVSTNSSSGFRSHSDNTGMVTGAIIGGIEGGLGGAIMGGVIGSLFD